MKRFFRNGYPNCKDYEIATSYHIEMYNDPTEYTKGAQDKKYCREIWVPVQQK